MESVGQYTIYDPEQRMKIIRKNLEKELNQVSKQRQEDDNKISQHNSVGGGDSTMQYVEEMKEKAKALEREVENFTGEHFTPVYRSLFHQAEQYQLKLDEMDITGREDIRRQRKGILDMLNEVTEKLNKKTHADGKPCPDCELQKI